MVALVSSERANNRSETANSLSNQADRRDGIPRNTQVTTGTVRIAGTHRLPGRFTSAALLPVYHHTIPPSTLTGSSAYASNSVAPTMAPLSGTAHATCSSPPFRQNEPHCLHPASWYKTGRRLKFTSCQSPFSSAYCFHDLTIGTPPPSVRRTASPSSTEQCHPRQAAATAPVPELSPIIPVSFRSIGIQHLTVDNLLGIVLA